MQYLQTGAQTKIANVASGVARSNLENPTTTTAGPTTTAPATTTTTVPPTTTPPTTTTTVKPTTTTTTTPPTTTTTVTPTTTTAKPVSSSATLSSIFTELSGDQWRATTTVTVLDTSGRPVVGAVVAIDVTTVDKKGRQSTANIEVTTGPGGVVSITKDKMAASGGSRIDTVDFDITDVRVPTGYTWDGRATSGSAARPG